MPRPLDQRNDSDLTDAQWEAIEPLLRDQRLRRHALRDLLDALFYVVKGGVQWRMLPKTYPPWQTVYYHLRRWEATGLLERVNHALREAVRREAGRDPSPSAAVIGSQSVKTTHVGGPRSFDGGKRVNGRKRHILTDTLGLLLAVLVHPAGVHDSQRVPHRAGGRPPLDRVQGRVPRLEVVFADQGYEATPTGLIWRVFGWLLQIVEREPGQKGFVVLKKRWVVERTFAWLGLSRRLSKDYEVLPEVSEAMVLLASIRLMVRRLA